MKIDYYSPQSGRYIDENGNIRNFVDEILAAGSTAQPIEKGKLKISQYSPRSGRFIAEDGSVYNLKDLIENIGGGGTVDTYTKAEIDNKISAIVQEIDWKEPVATFADLTTIYPDAEEGWTASTLDTDRIYRFNGTTWVDIYVLPQIATEYNDGLMSSQHVRALNSKVDAVAGKQLSTEDYTAAEKLKLAGVAAGAEVNVQADWDESNSNADAYIQNKPTLGAAAAKDSTNAVTQGSTALVESGAVKTYVDNAIANITDFDEEVF